MAGVGQGTSTFEFGLKRPLVVVSQAPDRSRHNILLAEDKVSPGPREPSQIIVQKQ